MPCYSASTPSCLGDATGNAGRGRLLWTRPLLSNTNTTTLFHTGQIVEDAMDEDQHEGNIEILPAGEYLIYLLRARA